MNIRIGNNNKIKKSTIGHQYNSKGEKEPFQKKEKFNEKHPILFTVIFSLITGFILLFSFWNKLITWIENILTF